MTIAEYNKSVDLHADGVFRFILKNLGDEESSRDIVQEAFVRLWTKRKDVTYEKTKTYLFTTAYHLLIDMVRKEKNRKAYLAHNGFEKHSSNAFSDLREVLGEAVAKLPEIQRTVIMLRDYEGYSYKEIGEITRLNEPQVKVYIYRARKFLKEYIGSMDVVI
jgi:RNA polymerase sigma-70 factor (ECF subfamily)